MEPGHFAHATWEYDPSARWDTADGHLAGSGIELTQPQPDKWNLVLPWARGMTEVPVLVGHSEGHPPVELINVVWPLVGQHQLAPRAKPTSADHVPGELSAKPDLQELFDHATATSAGRLRQAIPWILALDENEAQVRQARVAVRRLRTQIRAFRSTFGKRPRTLQDQLGDLNDTLRSVRDLDIVKEVIQDVQHDLRHIRADQLSQLETIIGQARRLQNNDLRAELIHTRTHKILEQLSHPPICTVEPQYASRQAAELARTLLATAYGTAASQAVIVGTEPGLDAHLRLRTLVRRLRVTAMATTPLLGVDAQRFARRVAEPQGELGTLADLNKTQNWLTMVRDQEPTSTALIDQLAAAVRRRTERSLNTWRGGWERVNATNAGNWLNDVPNT
jgi:CHAD domain-containing protein